MKKLLLILLSAFAITACGGEDKEAENQPEKTTVMRLYHNLCKYLFLR